MSTWMAECCGQAMPSRLSILAGLTIGKFARPAARSSVFQSVDSATACDAFDGIAFDGAHVLAWARDDEVGEVVIIRSWLVALRAVE